MTLEVDLGEFLNAYLAEADEHVAVANDKLLAVERAIQANTNDGRAIRELFRTLHTLKGLSAMVGVDPIVALAHSMEAIVRACDRTGSAPARDVVELLFRGLKAVEERLRVLARGGEVEPAPAELLERFQTAETAKEKGGRTTSVVLDLDPALERKLAPFERELLLSAGAQGKRALRADFVPTPARTSAGLTINTVRERVSALGEIVRVFPITLPLSEQAPGGLGFALLIVTTATDAQIAAELDAAPERVQDITHVVQPDSLPAEPFDELEGAPQEGSRHDVLRVDVARVDDSMERLALLLVTRSRLVRAVADLTAAGAPTRDLQGIIQEASRQLRDLRASILRLRVVPVTDVLARLPLLVRGLSRSSGKDIRLLLEANEAELDKSVAERMFPALVHLLRNAADHGVEPAPERLRRSKPPHGTIRVSCTMISNRQIQIRIADDGAGIDNDALAKFAGHPVEPNGAAILDVLCRAGMSTRTEVSATSGRGMGMEIVRRIIVDELRGELSLVTTRGEGAIFTLRIPLTVSMVDAFTVRCGEDVFAVPVTSVEEIIEIGDGDVVETIGQGGRPVRLLSRRGEAVPLLDLLDALGHPELEAQKSKQAIVVRRGGAPVAFRLDRVIGQHETVVRPLVDPLVQVMGVAGSADLGDGRATLVLDLVALAAKVEPQRRQEDVA